MKRHFLYLGFVLCFVLTALRWSHGDEPETAANLLEEFAAKWDESSWTGGRRAYIRQPDDAGWQLRMGALRELTALRANAEKGLLTALKKGDAPTRILAAQALGYTGFKASSRELLAMIEKEPDPSVRLYLVDAVGMAGKGPEASAWLAKWRTKERNGDVRKHIGYLLQREDNGVDPAIVRTLGDFEMATADSAKLGELAPDFRLRTVDGKEVQLSRFRDRQPVVLVFIYGDT